MLLVTMPFSQRVRSPPVISIFARDLSSYTPQVDVNARNPSLILPASPAPSVALDAASTAFCEVADTIAQPSIIAEMMIGGRQRSGPRLTAIVSILEEHMRFSRRVTIASILLSTSLIASAQSDAQKALDRFKSMVGTWTGKSAQGQPSEVTYR